METVTRKRQAVAPEAWFHLIRSRCGLTFRTTQHAAVLDTLREQRLASGVRTEGEYYERLATEPEGGSGWTALVERLLNHETSFFRHPQSFDALRAHILPEVVQSAGGRRLNLWSAGCSTGQEAYSMAMVTMAAINDDGLRSDFTVWGGDISRHAIEVARRGRYGPRAIAGMPDDYRQRFLRPIGAGLVSDYEVVEEVRRRCRFTATNLLAACAVNLTYDVIFCHNVLIYFAPLAVSQVVALLTARLALGGYLLLGPGEASGERPHALEPVTLNGVRVFRRRGTTAAEAASC